jgi:hypothetical protein
LGVYAYPLEKQDKGQQLSDQSECWQWAATQTGVDPLQPAPATSPPPPPRSAGPGTVGGAAKGAAGGAVIGAIAGSAGKGAAIGTAVGGMRGHRTSRQAEATEQQRYADEQSAAANVRVDQFRTAFSACLGGRGYNVR